VRTNVDRRRSERNNYLEDETETEDLHPMHTLVADAKIPPIMLKLKVNQQHLEFQADTGCGTMIISDKTYSTLKNRDQLTVSDWKFSMYRGERCVPMGEFMADVTFQEETHKMKIQVVEGGGVPLAGRDFLARFGIEFSGIDKIYSMKSIDDVTSKYANVFDNNQGAYKWSCATLLLEEKAMPIFHKPRVVPLVLRDKVGEELDRLEKVGTIEKINYSRWGTPIVQL
jgi:hypothetical protein